MSFIGRRLNFEQHFSLAVRFAKTFLFSVFTLQSQELITYGRGEPSLPIYLIAKQTVRLLPAQGHRPEHQILPAFKFF
jgi:hypothetical protein